MPVLAISPVIYARLSVLRTAAVPNALTATRGRVDRGKTCTDLAGDCRSVETRCDLDERNTGTA